MCELDDSAGFLFIENVFYNDFRRSHKDYSQNIIAWANGSRDSEPDLHSQLNPAEFRADDMTSTTFQQLLLRLHVPYVFVHQGDCEHVLIFTDIRAMHPSDPPLRSAYPKMTFRSRADKRFCQLCEVRPATLALHDDPLAFDNPMVVCSGCDQQLHHGRFREGHSYLL